MEAFYCLDPTLYQPPPQGVSLPPPPNPSTYIPRMTALGLADVVIGDPTYGSITAWPSAVILSDAVAVVIIADDQGQATAAAVSSAITAAQTAETTITTNQATILTNIKSRQATIQAWITAHPTGGNLTSAQNLVLAEMLNGLCDLLLDLFSSTTGT